MHLQRLAKDQESYAVGGSPTMYLAENRMFGVPGITADAGTPIPGSGEYGCGASTR